jgi:hypothetical protein
MPGKYESVERRREDVEREREVNFRDSLAEVDFSPERMWERSVEKGDYLKKELEFKPPSMENVREDRKLAEFEAGKSPEFEKKMQEKFKKTFYPSILKENLNLFVKEFREAQKEGKLPNTKDMIQYLREGGVGAREVLRKWATNEILDHIEENFADKNLDDGIEIIGKLIGAKDFGVSGMHIDAEGRLHTFANLEDLYHGVVTLPEGGLKIPLEKLRELAPNIEDLNDEQKKAVGMALLLEAKRDYDKKVEIYSSRSPDLSLIERPLEKAWDLVRERGIEA